MRQIRSDWCMRAEDLYRFTNPSKWNITHTMARNSKSDNKWEYCTKVFLFFLELVFNDIIDNNITFEIPCAGSKEARIFVKCLSDDEFKEAYKRGAFKGIDFIKSGFKGYKLVFQWKYKKDRKEKSIYIDRTLKEKFYNHINNGKQYY